MTEMQKTDAQYVHCIDAKSLKAYIGYETFIYKIIEYHLNNQNAKYIKQLMKDS